MEIVGDNSCLNQIKNNMDYVDIHGRQIRVVVFEKTGEILIPINEVRETGFNIYRRTQYNKTLIDDGELIKELEMYLLDCAKTYILKNKVIFNETQILESIDKCKQALISKQNVDISLNSSDEFLKNRIIQGDYDEIQIQVKQENKPSSSCLTQKNLHSHNKHSIGGIWNESFEQSNGLKSSKEDFIESPELSCNGNQNSKQQKQYTLRSPNCNKDKLLENLDASSSSSESTTVINTKLKCTAILDLLKTYAVAVTFVEPKETVAWVQDVTNKALLVMIYDKVDEEARKQSAATPIRGKIYAACDEDHWYRCKVVKIAPLTVFFIDYGNTVEVSEVRPISDDLIKIPQLGIRISFKNATVHPEEAIEIIPLTRLDDGTYFVRIIKGSTQQQDDPSQKMNQQNESKLLFNNDQNSKQQFILGSPNGNGDELLHSSSSSSSESTTVNNTTLKNTVILDLLKTYSVVVTFVEPKETVAWVQDIANKPLLKLIYDKVEEEAKKQSPTIPARGKIYAAFNEDHWYRCKVVRISPLTVFFIDYGNTVEVSEVRPISDDLIKKPPQGIRISFKNATVEPEEIIEIALLKRLDDGTYFVQIIKESTQQQDDPSQKRNQQNESKLLFNNDQNSKQQYILGSSNGNRDELLVKLHSSSSSSSESTTVNNTTLKSTIILDLLKTYSVVVTFVEPKETVAWVQDIANKPLLEMIYDKVNEEAKNRLATIPARGKIYAAFNEDHWYRCKVVRISPLTVFCIDYGNTVEVSEVRPISDDLIKIPPQGIRISFKNATVKPGEIIEITLLKRFDDGTNFVRIIKEPTQQQNDPSQQMNQQKQYTLKASNCNKDELEKLHNAPCSESTTVNRMKLKCKAVLEMSKTYSVVVTFVERNEAFFWVQDIANKSLLEEIYDKVTEEAKKQSATTPIRTKIFAALDKDQWYRCKVLHTSPLRVLFIDYGNIVEVSEVRPISDDLAKIPQQGVRILLKNATTVKPEEKIEIIPTKRLDDGTYLVQIIKEPTRQQWNQQKTENDVEVFECFGLPDALENLEDNMIVKIDKLRNNKLTLRTRNSHNLYIEIGNKLSAVQPEPLKNIKINQIILCKNTEDGCYYRARILKNIDKDSVKIEYLDYYDEDIVPKQSIFAIPEELSDLQLSYVPIEQFKNVGPLSIQQVEFINILIKRKTKFTVNLNNNEFDLKYVDEDGQEVSFLNVEF